MKKILTVITLLFATRSATALEGDHLPHCDELADNSTDFVNSQNKTKSCAWVAEKDTFMRCQHPGVADHCPVSCNAACLTDPPSASPSSAPTNTIRCIDRVDTTEKFDVDANNDGIYKSKTCAWVEKKDTMYRCSFEIVKWNCQVLCDLECDNITPAPTPAPTSKPQSFAKANSGPEPAKKRFPYSIVFGTLGGGLLVGTVAFAVRAKPSSGFNFPSRDSSSNEEINPHVNTVQFDEVEDVAQEGYNRTGLFGWARQAAPKPKTNVEVEPEIESQPEPELEEVQVQVPTQLRSNHWRRRQY